TGPCRTSGDANIGGTCASSRSRALSSSPGTSSRRQPAAHEAPQHVVGVRAGPPHHAARACDDRLRGAERGLLDERWVLAGVQLVAVHHEARVEGALEDAADALLRPREVLG